MIRIDGDPLSNPQFVVRMEYRQITSRSPLQYSAPEVETVPTVFALDAQGRYAGTIIPERPGILRVAVQVSGQRPSGQTFSDEVLLSNVRVSPLVARFLGLTEQAIDADGNGTLDRWEVTAKLDVVVPGKFGMRLYAAPPAHAGTEVSVEKVLGAGEQTLTVTLSAEQIPMQLFDGPWTMQPQIFRPEGNTFGESVAVPRTIQSKAYKLDDWDKGQAYGEKTITMRGILPNASGQFRFLEVLWDVATPGTRCSWNGDTYSSDSIYGHQQITGDLPAGRTTVSFFFDAAIITSDTKRQWQISPRLYCQYAKVPRDNPLFLKLNVNPSDYEDRNESFLLMGGADQFRPGESSSPFLELVAVGKGKEPVKFRVTEEVPGLIVRVSQPISRGIETAAAIKITASPTVAPGRYLIPFEATATGGTATTVVLVDVVK